MNRAGAPGRRAGVARLAGLLGAGVAAAMVPCGCGGGVERTASATRVEAPRGAEAGLEVRWWIVTERPARLEFVRVEDGGATPDDTAAPSGRNAAEDGAPIDADAARAGGGQERQAAGRTTARRVEATPGPSIGEVLGPYLDRPVPLSPAQVERWRLNGLRIVNVPLADLEAVRRRLSLAGAVHAQWLGERPEWTAVAAGPAYERPLRVITDRGEVDLGPGRMRVLARCWSVPLPGEDGTRAGLRLEVVPQYESRPSLEEALEVRAGLVRRPRNQLADGPVFEELLLATTLDEDAALVIVPEAPATGWGSGGTGREATEAVFPLPTVGEALLAAGPDAGGLDARAVLVLLPRTAERFSLLGGGAAESGGGVR